MQDKRTYDDDYGSNKNANQKNQTVITDKNGNVVDRVEVDAGKDYSYTPVYKKEDGTWTNDPLDVARYSIDSTGAIQLTAPKSLYEVPEFHQIFDQDTLKSYSAAYRSNPAYRVPYTKRNEDGTTEETQITIPEFVEELNSALGNFIENYRVAEKNKKNLVTQYGDKASKLSLTQLSTISSANASANRVYLPDFIFNFQNSFTPLKSKRDEDGTVSVEDFMEYYKLGKTSDTELAGIMATIEGHLKGSEWGEDTVTFDDGTSMKNANSMTEAVRAMALKNFILSKDPDAEWYDSLGASAATLSLNFAEGMTRVFANLATAAEGIVTFGQSHIIQNATEEMDKSMSDWNQQRALIQDSTGTLATLGQIGGMIAGTAAEVWLTKKVGGSINSAFKAKVAEGQAAREALLSIGPSAKAALTAESMSAIVNDIGNISLGAKFAMAIFPTVQKVSMATSTAKAFLGAHGALNWTTSFLLDTVHDAIFYDAVTLRHVIEGDSDQDVKNYWLGQLEDNAKWWIGTGFAKTTFRMAGQTNFGQALNAKATQKIQGMIAKVGDTKKLIKDNIYGGDAIRHMEEIRDSLESGAKKDRLNKKIDIAKGEEVLRKERKALANLDLDWDGLKLTEESMQNFRDTLNNIKTWENAIDARAAGTTQKVQELVGQIKDPSTGRIVYVNPSLGVANMKAGNIYGKLMGYTQDYNLPRAAGSNLSQDIVDYLGGKAERIRKLPISQGDGPNAAAALKNIEQIDANLAAIKMRLPEKVLAYLDAPETLDSYFTFYRELRNYQDAKNLIDRGLLASYRGEGGELTDKYMPIVKAMDESDIIITRKSGTRARRLDESFEEFTYSVKENQHYVDPEIVRQRALWQVAEEEISQNLRKAYDNMSSATKVELASGETTERARDLGIKNKDLETTISIYADSYTQNWKLDTTPPKEKRKISKNIELSAADKNEIVATLSLDDTRQILHRYNVLTGGNLNLSDMVNAENYVKWFNDQPQTVKNYLLGIYNKYMDDVVDPGAVEDAFEYDYYGSPRVSKWTQDEWNAYSQMTNTLNHMAMESSALGSGNAKLYDEVREFAEKARIREPYHGVRTVGSLKTEIIKRLEDYGLSTKSIEKIDVPSRQIGESVADKTFWMATDADYPGFKVDLRDDENAGILRMLDESDPKATREGTLRDYYRDWKGKEIAVLEMEPGDYNQLMKAGGKWSDHILDEDKIDDYAERFKNGERAPLIYAQYDGDGNLIGQEGRHRDAAALKSGVIEKVPVIIEYPKGKFPEQLRKFNDVTEDFVLRNADEFAEDAFDPTYRTKTAPKPGTERYLKQQLDELFNSKSNKDFLAKLGYENGYHFYGDRGGGYWRKTRSFGHYSPVKDQLGINWKNMPADLKSLESLEFHEITHMLWQRASVSTRKAIGQNLVDLIGIKNLTIDDAAACSKHMNELVAHAMETRFQAKKGWDVLKNDSVTKEHIEALAKYAGLKPTEAFKTRVMDLVRSFVTFVKTKFLGINEAKTFDDFYYGLLNGDFSKDLKTPLNDFADRGLRYYDELRSKRKLTELDAPNGPTIKVDVTGGDSKATNVPVYKETSPRKLDVRDYSNGTQDIDINFYPYTENNYDLFKRAFQDGGDDFEAGLQRAWLAGDENVGKKGLMNQLLGDMLAGKDSFADGYIKLETRQALRNVLKLDTDPFVDSMYTSIKEATDDFVKNVTENPLVKRATQAIADGNENGAELASKYTALKYLNKKGKKDLADSVEEEIRKSLKGKGLKSDDVDLVVKRAQMMVDEYVKSELNDVRNALKTTNAALVDDNDMLKEVKKLHSQIYDSKTGLTHAARKDMSSNVIVYRDEMGREVYAEVDPNFASLYKMRYQLSNKEASALAKFNAATSKLFRYGTTTLNLSSFSNQLFRDTGNALMLGGSWQTIKHNANNLVEVFGDDIVEQIKRFEPEYEMKQLTEYANMNKMSLQEAAVSREMARGAALSPATTETTLYKNVLRDLSTSPDGTIAGMNRKINNVLNKFASVDEWTNGRREEYLRKRVFANNLNRAMEQGYTLAQARSYATFAMNNATTNFTRQIYHMQAIADSTPYFRAAINGTKSFWRMWSIDPVGVSGRIMGGLILPTIFLTGASLGDPDNREVYKNIPEYQKDENLVFVVDKQIITIPIPQEMANIVSPFRQFVENVYYNDENSFWELMMNDALGFSPVDLQGFSTVDMDKMSKDPTIGDRISRGFARIFSQVAPVPVRSTYMMVTGTDPYTGKNLYDPAYTYWDDDTNSVQTMNENQNAFARWVAKLWGKDSNAAVLEKVTSSIFGSTGANVLGELTTLIEEGPEAAGSQLAEDAIAQATNPYYANAYNEADAVWKRAVRTLTAEKDQLTSSDEFKTIYSELSQTTDESKRKKLMSAGQDLINEYQNKVITTVERLSSVYKGTYDRKKFAATIQLLNFNTDPIYQTGTQYSSSIASDAFYEGREAAISTMQAMGVSGTSDLSIFGYLVTDDEGKSVMKYSTPVAIMDMKNAWMGAGDVDQANIEAKLKTDGIKTSDMWDGYYTAKAQGKAALKQYKSDWNAKVVKSLAPYISERGVDAVMKNSATRDLLDNYLFIDNLYQTKAYLKKIFENE